MPFDLDGVMRNAGQAWSNFMPSQAPFGSAPFGSSFMSGGGGPFGGNRYLMEPQASKPATTPTGNSALATAAAQTFTAKNAGTINPDADQWSQKAQHYATAHGIDPNLFDSQMRWESGNYSPDVISGQRKSSAGATGIAQLMPQFHPGVNPTDPDASLDYAAGMMSNLLKNNGGDWRKALVAYNGGQGALLQYNAGTPYPESQSYLDHILTANSYGGTPTQSLSSSQTQDRLVGLLQAGGHKLGETYDYGGNGVGGRGFDCSGLVSWIGQQLQVPGITGRESTFSLLPKTQLINEQDARPGDLVFYNTESSDPHVQHVAIYMGDGKILQSGGNQHAVNIGDAHQAIGSPPQFRRNQALTDAIEGIMPPGPTQPASSGNVFHPDPRHTLRDPAQDGSWMWTDPDLPGQPH